MKANIVGVEEEKNSILLALNDYLQGRSMKDIERLRSAFHRDAYIRTIIEGNLVQWTLQQYLNLVEQAAIQDCQPKILSYTWDGDTGSAHVQLNFTTFRFIDRFNLIKLNGIWLIIDKLSFRQEPL